MSVAGAIKKAKLEAAMQRRLERGKKKAEAKALRAERKLKGSKAMDAYDKWLDDNNIDEMGG